MRPDACGICLLKQTASGAQSVTSPSKIEGFREFERTCPLGSWKGELRENNEKETEKSSCIGDGSSYAGRCTIAAMAAEAAPADAAVTAEAQPADAAVETQPVDEAMTAETQPEIAMQAADEDAAGTALPNGVDPLTLDGLVQLNDGNWYYMQNCRVSGAANKTVKPACGSWCM